MYWVYIIFSEELDKYYIGPSKDLTDCICRHRNSGSKSTKGANDWTLKYKEEFETRQAAVARELQIKRKKSRK